ncbi:dehydrogenase [Streptomyces sp. TS71-3]|nr:dehydrogenase [Streptomyces sp. TS71-3]
MIGAVHAAAIRSSGGTVRGVLASSAQRSVQVAEEWDAPIGYPDFEAVLGDDRIDVVHICTPNALHAHQTEAALRAGKHVVCEKPMATSVADAERVTRLAQAKGLVLAVPFAYRYHPLVHEIRARRLAGEFGGWQVLHGSYLQDWMLDQAATSWRVDPVAGGASRAFADIGSHWCDLVEWVAGVRFTEVVARFGTTIGMRPRGTAASFSGVGAGESPDEPTVLAPVETEDVAALLLRTAEGVLATLTVSQVSAGRKNRLWFELDGSRASAVFDQERPEEVWLGGVEESRVIVRDPDHGSGAQRRLSRLPAGHGLGYVDCFRAFVADAYAAIDAAPPDGLPTGVDGLRSARLVDAVLRSHAVSAWTRIDTASHLESTT